MTDKEILDEVYKMCCNPFERCDVKSFIEQEWQKADEAVKLGEELHDEMCRHDPWMNVNENSASHGYFSNSWYNKDKKFKNRNDV